MSENGAVVAETTSAIATKITLSTGGATSFLALVAQVDWLAVLGIVIALSGFYFSFQRNKREKEEHKLRMKNLKDQCDVKN